MQRTPPAVVGVFEPNDLGAKLVLAALENLDLGLALGVRLVPKTAGIAACCLGLAAGNEESSRQDPQRRSQRMIPHKDLRKRVTPKAPERLGNCSSCPLSLLGRFCGLFLPGGGTHHTAPAAISAGFPAFGKTRVATPSRMAATPMPPAVQIEIKPRLPPF